MEVKMERGSVCAQVEDDPPTKQSQAGKGSLLAGERAAITRQRQKQRQRAEVIRVDRRKRARRLVSVAAAEKYNESGTASVSDRSG